MLMLMAPNRETFDGFPALHCADTAIQIRGDLFPTVEPLT
jgi:hypothetical protein